MLAKRWTSRDTPDPLTDFVGELPGVELMKVAQASHGSLSSKAEASGDTANLGQEATRNRWTLQEFQVAC